MRVGLISDLHAMLPALDAVLAELDQANVDQIICLGDIVDMGPQPAEVLDRLAERNIVCIQGNHDPLDENPEFPMLRVVEQWTRDRLGADRVAALTALPTELMVDLAGHKLLCVHGSPNSFNDQVLDSTPWSQLAGWWGDRQFDVMACGHTHVQLLRRQAGHTIVNVGSVGQPFAAPFSGAPPRVLKHCDFAIVEGGPGGVSVELRRTALPWDAFVQSLRDADFPDPERWLQQWSGS
ncbi:MAG: metallophosphoesterase family protein [Myxococcales bacterium]|nr:metallophosphoesterase family protein [Myxococcales bacterium]